jgi:DNA-binding MarR family transcriptional regulator
MSNYTNLKKVIDWTEQFENQLRAGEQWTDENFAVWLSNQVTISKQKDVVSPKKPKPAITMYVYFMYKYALFYSRKIFKNSMIYSIDDFSVLESLLPDKQLMKADVIRKNVTEKSSGNEVLKRLLRQQLIEETKNPNDKRSKLLKLTPAGFAAINAVRIQLEKMGNLVAGDLTEQEKEILITMLSRLNDYHRPLFDANDEKLINNKLGIEN